MNRHSLAQLIAFLLAISVVFSPSQAQGIDSTSDYKVSPQDTLAISVVGEKDLTYECKVTSSGTITYAWLSNVQVAGKTAAEIEQKLRADLDKDYLVDPTVIVSIKDYRAREVTVMGQVNKPGAITIPAEQGLTIVEAVGRAGGITKGGDSGKIWYTKRGKEKVRMSLESLNRITDREKILVEPGDVIEVGEKVF